MNNTWGIMFSGQGAQKAQMGLDCYQSDQDFKETIDAASEVLKMSLPEILQNDQGQLAQTKYVQPSLVAVSLGFYRMLQRDLPQLTIGAMVGLSLGEYSALIASRKLDFKTGMQLLKKRAEAMQTDSEQNASAMEAIMDPQIEKVNQLCKQLTVDGKQVSIANYNSPNQIVIGGTIKAVQEAADTIMQKKLASKAINLKVSGAFHTPLYQHTETVLKQALEDVKFHITSIPVMSNTTGKPFELDDLASILAQQVVCPTHFQACFEKMVADYHVDAVVEIGAGRTLSKLAKTINPNVSRAKITNYKSYQKFLKKADETHGT